MGYDYFNEWLDTVKIIATESKEELKNRLQTYSICSLKILEKIYNLYEDTGLLDVVEVYELDNEYLVTHDEAVEMSTMLNLINELYITEYLNNITLGDFMDDILYLHHGTSVTEKFYCLLTLNPKVYNPAYIKEVQDILNKDITTYTDANQLLYEFNKLFREDPIARAIIITTYNNFAIQCFYDIKDYNRYIEALDEFAEDPFLNGQLVNLGTVDNLDEIIKKTKEFAPNGWIAELDDDDDDDIILN